MVAEGHGAVRSRARVEAVFQRPVPELRVMGPKAEASGFLSWGSWTCPAARPLPPLVPSLQPALWVLGLSHSDSRTQGPPRLCSRRGQFPGAPLRCRHTPVFSRQGWGHRLQRWRVPASVPRGRFSGLV